MAKKAANKPDPPKARQLADTQVTITGVEPLHNWSLRFTLSDGSTRECIVSDIDGVAFPRELLIDAVRNTIARS